MKKCDRSKYRNVSKMYVEFDLKMNNLAYRIEVKWYFNCKKIQHFDYYSYE